MATEAMGSAWVQPVAMITTPATSTATEPNRSPSTSRYAPRTVRLCCEPACSRRSDTRLTSRPSAAITSIGPVSTSDGSPKSLQCLEQDEGGHTEQQHGVGCGGQDLEPVVAERLADRGRARPEADGQQCQAHAHGIGQHVAGVGQQGQAVGEEAADHLDQ